MTTKSGLKLVIAVVAALAVTGLALVGAAHFGTRIYKDSLASPSWPSIAGKVLTSSVTKGCGKQNGFFPEVAYTYVVHGRHYTGDRMAFIKRFCGSRHAAEQIAALYKPGNAVTVYFDPENPSDAVLTRGDKGGAATFGLLLIFLAPVGAAWLVVLGIHQSRLRWGSVDSKALSARQAALGDGIQKEIDERKRENEKSRQRHHNG